MNILRRLGGILLALALTAVAAPALAQSKIYSLTVPPTSVAAGLTTTIFATFKNETPNGNSSFNSIQDLTVTGPLSIIGVSVPSGVKQPNPIPPTGVKTISISSMSPVKRGETFVVTLTVKGDATGTACGPSPATWTVGNVWTGSSFSGDTFLRILPGNTNPTIVTASCTLAFVNEPTNAVAGFNVTSVPFNPTATGVKVQLYVNAAPSTSSTTSVALSSPCLAGAVSQTSSSGLATFPPLPSNALGGKSCKLTATVASHTGPQSASFDLFVPSLAFVNQPNNALLGVVITDKPFNTPAGSFVQVQLLLDGIAGPLPAGFAPATVAMSSACSIGVPGGSASVDPSSGKATFSALNITAAAPLCSLTAAALGKSAGPTGNFSIVAFAPQGMVDCGQPLPNGPEIVGIVGMPNPVNPGEVYGIRGPFDAKPTVCVPVNSQFTNKLNDDGTITHKWDTVKAPSGAWYYQVNGKLKDLLDGWPDPAARHPKVAWLFNDTGAPSNIHYGLTCLSSKLPVPYGRVPVAGLGAGDTSFTLDMSTPPTGGFEAPVPTPPFPIYVDQERMTVTAIGATWTVIRGQPGTTAAAHTGSTYVMSTPLPPNATNTGVEQVCIVSVGWRLYEPGKYFWHVDAIDIGDGWIGTEE